MLPTVLCNCASEKLHSAAGSLLSWSRCGSRLGLVSESENLSCNFEGFWRYVPRPVGAQLMRVGWKAAACEVALSRQCAAALEERVDCEVQIFQSKLDVEWDELKRRKRVFDER